MNLEKYSRIKDYKLMPGDIEKLWDTVGGSMWEIQYLLSPLAERPIAVVLEEYKKKMLGFNSCHEGSRRKEDLTCTLPGYV